MHLFSIGGQPGASAMAEYRRRRAHELAHWATGLPWRLGVVAFAGGAAAGLAAWSSLSRPWVVVGLVAFGSAIWAVRFRRSPTTRAWRDGARGERATARRLRRLEHDGYLVLHDLAIPGSLANIDHLVIGPSGVFVIGSRRYRGRIRQTQDGMLWHGRYPQAQVLATLWWEARLVGDALALGPHVPVTPLLVIHRAIVPWGGLMVAGMPVTGPDGLPELLLREPVLPGEEVRWLAERAVRLLGPANDGRAAPHAFGR
jgi:Nuclease-related domain